MVKILFVCLGNICRSPMAEFIMKDKVKKAGLSDKFEIASAAIADYNVGIPVYPPARDKLAEHGIDCSEKRGYALAKEDYQRFDLIIAMEQRHISAMKNICGGDPDNKISLIMDYTDTPGDVADPWYTRDFETTWREVNAGCDGLLNKIKPKL